MLDGRCRFGPRAKREMVARSHGVSGAWCAPRRPVPRSLRAPQDPPGAAR